MIRYPLIDKVSAFLQQMLETRASIKPRAQVITAPENCTASELAPAAEAPAPSHPLAEAALWHALPGKRLELGATGFFIEFKKTAMPFAGDQMAYVAYSPEGQVIALHGSELPALKRYCEQQARHREEFPL